MLGEPMATKGVDLPESLELSAGSLGSWVPSGSGSGSVSDDTVAGTLDGSEQTRVRDDAVLPRGAAVGRYVVLGKLGAGAMGVVYTAHDPELDRKVALKLLRPRGGAERVAKGHRRLLAEAQALARLSHPNVVVVHDVGEHTGQVFVAMEFVEGHTLAAWIGQGRHPWPEALDVLVQAGRGLAAAHARDLVHRDFKPDNVMIGDDGRVRVMDFGLARATEVTSTGEASSDQLPRTPEALAGSGPPVRALRVPEAPALHRRSRELVLTHGEGMVGTPAYAAPEQLAGGRGGAAGDQFSFCVTLWEALHGCRPFVGETLPELAAKILAGELAEPPPGARVPPWLRRIVERGLAKDAERRWPSMDALLTALARGRTRARQRKGVGAAALVVATAAGVAGWRYESEQRRIRACEAEGAAITEVWNDEVATALRDAMVATGVGHAEVTAQKLTPWLDAQARGWQESRTTACLHAEVEGTWDADTLDRSRWCLDERRMELEALVGELRRGTASSLAAAVPAATRLLRLETCTDPFSLSRLPAPPMHERAAIVEVRVDLLHAGALQQTGSYDEGLEVARGALEQAQALAWPPLVAAARRRVGALHERRGEYAEAEATLEAAYFEAGRADAMEVAADAARDLVGVVGDRLARQAEGFRWAHHHEVALVRTPDPTGLRRASHLEGVAIVRQALGEHAEAKQAYEQVLDLRSRALGAEHPEVYDTLGNLATVLHDMGAYEDARALNEQGLALREQVLGPAHPDVGKSLNNLANNHRALGGNVEAKALYERALSIWEASLGPEHPHVAQVLNNLANTMTTLGDAQAAEALHLRALAIRERVLGPDHPQVAQSLGNLATMYDLIGEHRKAMPLHRRTLVIYERALGPEHPDVARVLANLGNSCQLEGMLGAARAAHERALAIRERVLGPQHAHVGQSLQSLADVELRLGLTEQAKHGYERALELWDVALGPDNTQQAFALLGLSRVATRQGRDTDAVSLAERALELRTKNGAPPLDLGYARFSLARARWSAGEDRARIITLAEQALASFREASHTEMVAEVQEWLDEDPEGPRRSAVGARAP
jgi:tetratricopeptide (TPR) repeat protein